ncbi:Bug family tripartite tricarboxylate transporter substrate binding protein [Azohydromonas lata]|uniref:Tripartite tricarboxylate transporter substrate binding protein n=1 Tax=Azohydromonas lata TaxID=45677 RepID=A0ABU5IAW4_9BURK|nr:tripartite tricarboxylate transporter substrate binding protein [Azohydromonas lata]MDZ5456251.1 tripartite tricarboxylate transporter substrate binding protein [Azohydromonas lata]
MDEQTLNMRRRRMLGMTLALTGAGMPLPGWSQGGEFPKPGTPIRYVVPFPPGGLTDVMARAVGQQLGERWKTTVVVDNRAGGGGQIGADTVAKAPANGHTLLAITLTHAVNYSLFPGASYNFVQDLRPVALLAASPMLVVVAASSQIKSFKDLMEASKGRQLNGGSSGNGTPPHLTLALFNQLNKSAIQHVPYKGGTPCIQDLMGNQLDVVFSNFPESVAHVKSGKLRALALCSAARNALVPDVPTTAELGLAELQVENWTGIMAPARTADAVVDKLSAEVVRIMRTADIEERARTQGFRVDARDAQAFAPYLKAEVERWGRLVKTANITSL